MSIEKFKSYYVEEKNRINLKIDEFNSKLVKEENSILRYNYDLFRNLNQDGKLVRGTLVNLGYHLLSDNKNYSDNLALAYEVFQTAILVHDDIIDNDSKRRGKDTIHYSNYNKYRKYTNKDDELKSLSNSIAICMGDYGLFQANKIISDNYYNDTNLAKVLSYFNETVLKTIRGELLDVITPFESKYDIIDKDELEKDIMEIYRLKTAHYTIIGPLSTGMILAGADENKLNDIEKLGEKIGIAFQIQDDILGIYSEETGKVIGSDIKEAKQTILYTYTYNTEYKEELMKYYGNDNITEEIIEKVKDIFDVSGAKNYANHMMNKLYDEATEILNNISWMEKEKKELLAGFIEYLRTRKK